MCLTIYIDTNHVTDERRSVKLANACGNYIPIMRIIPNYEKNENICPIAIEVGKPW